jgi:hypothetical protein
LDIKYETIPYWVINFSGNWRSRPLCGQRLRLFLVILAPCILQCRDYTLKKSKVFAIGGFTFGIFTPLQIDYQQITQGETPSKGFHLCYHQDSFTCLLIFNKLHSLKHRCNPHVKMVKPFERGFHHLYILTIKILGRKIGVVKPSTTKTFAKIAVVISALQNAVWSSVMTIT